MSETIKFNSNNPYFKDLVEKAKELSSDGLITEELSELTAQASKDGQPEPGRKAFTSDNKKSEIIDLVRLGNLSDRQLVIMAKYLDGDEMADEPDVAAKLLAGMLRTLHKESASDPVSITDINKFIDQVDKDLSEDDDTIRNVMQMVGKVKFEQLSANYNPLIAKIKTIAKNPLF